MWRERLDKIYIYVYVCGVCLFYVRNSFFVRSFFEDDFIVIVFIVFFYFWIVFKMLF